MRPIATENEIDMSTPGPKEKLLAALAKAYKDDHSRHAFDVLDAIKTNVTDKSTIEDVSELFQKIAKGDGDYLTALTTEIDSKRKRAENTKALAEKHFSEAWDSAKHLHFIDAYKKRDKARLEEIEADVQSAGAWAEALPAIPAVLQVEHDKSEAVNLIALSQKAGFKHRGR